MKRRALLLAGGVSHRFCEVRYRNDLRAFHDALVGALGFSPDDVRICFADGSDPVLAATASDLKSASRADVDAALGWLASDLSADDLLLLVASNHGEREGLCLWGRKSFLRVADIEAALGSCPAAKVLIFGQCYAGSFGDLDLARSVICCACDRDQSSFAREPAPPDDAHDYDEFLYHLVAAFAGRYPDGAPYSAPPAVTLADAFEYAKGSDRHPDETPTLFDREGIAPTIHLGPR